jgi:SWIM zinc finger
MSSEWTRESVLRLAPDANSARAGQELATARKWVSFNKNANCIWGLCQGSGSKPYQSIIDLSEPAFKCSCPSRKFPCKHGLGLLLLFAMEQASFANTEPPAWVAEWLAGRAERAAKKAEAASKPAEPVDLEAQAARREKRMDRIASGLESLRTWVDDLVRQGIAGVPSKGYAFFDEPARRMIDAQAPGLARMIQNLGAIAHGGAGWHVPFIKQLASLHVLLRAAERMDQLAPATREDLLAAVGVPVAQEEVLALPSISDTWQVVAQEIEMEDKLRVQRTWLFGIEQRRPALVLHFAHGTGPFDASFVPGTEFAGEVCMFPGNGVRGMVKSRQRGKAIERLSGYETVDALCDAYAEKLARQPWLRRVVVPLRNIIPARDESSWYFMDSESRRMSVHASTNTGWRMLAVSGGNPVELVVQFDGDVMEPVAIVEGSEYISLSESFMAETSIA